MKRLKDTSEALMARSSKRLWKAGLLLPVVGLMALLLSRGATAQMAEAPAIVTFNAAMPDPNAPISANRMRAYQIYKAITSVSIAIDDARLVQMEQLIAQGNERGAAKIAIADPSFFDFRLRDIARKMATREESIQTPLNDFVATYVGVARDDIDARQLLKGNFYYRADATKTLINNANAVRADVLNDIVNSNNHYQDIQSNNFSLYAVLVREDGQKYNSNNAIAVLPDAAGLITTRGFIAAHADAGTNRRLVEHTFRQFMCVAMEEWMDAARPDDFVGRDVDRFPGGSNDKYQVTCKACHTQMDAFRQVFKFVDFTNNRLAYNPAQVVGKMNRNANMFPEGYITTMNSGWVNYATGPKNADQFGWRGPASGTTMNQFGSLIADSKGFSRCLTKRLFTGICKRAPTTGEEPIIRKIADEFEKDYKIKSLAEHIVVNQACIAKE